MIDPSADLVVDPSDLRSTVLFVLADQLQAFALGCIPTETSPKPPFRGSAQQHPDRAQGARRRAAGPLKMDRGSGSTISRLTLRTHRR